MNNKNLNNEAMPARRGRPSKDDPRFICTKTASVFSGFRPSPKLMDRIKARASEEHQSINSTICGLVEYALNNLDYKKL